MEKSAKKELDKLIAKVLEKEGLNLKKMETLTQKELEELNLEYDAKLAKEQKSYFDTDLNKFHISEFDFNIFSNTVGEVFWLRDKSGKKLLFVSKAYEKVFGKSCKSLYENPRSFLENILPDDLPIVLDKMNKLSTGDPFEVDYRIKKDNSDIAWIRSKTKPIYDQENNLYGYSGIAIDITDLKTTEFKLRDANRFFEEAGNMTRIGSWEFLPKQNLLHWSRVTKEIYEVLPDYQPKLEEATQFYEPSFSKELINSALAQAIETGLEFDHEMVIITSKGNKKWVRAIGRTEFKNGICERIYGTFQDIQNIKEYERGLRIERDRLANVLEGTMAGTWEWEILTGRTIFNEKWANMLGYSLLEISPTSILTWENLVHPDDLLIAEANVESYFNKETEYYEAEFRMKHKNGNWIWILDRGKAFKWDKQGKPTLMAGTQQDITKRKIAEEQLKKFSVAIEQSPASIVITNKFAEIEYVNPYFCKITGYTMEEVIGKNPRILKSGDKSKEEYQQLWSNIRAGKQWDGEFKNKKKNGELFWESASISPIKDANGEINYFIAVKEEITYKKKIEELLLASEQKYRSIFELSPFGMAAIQPNGKVELINKKLEELIGYSIDEIKDIHCWMELVFPDEAYRNQVLAKRDQEFIQMPGQGIPSEPMEVEVKTKLGETKTFELTHVQIGEFQISVFNDISERNSHLKAIEKQNEILREISWIQSHVVRAPLARMMGLLEFVENKEYDLIPEADLLGLLRVSMDELDGHINEISKKAYLVNFLANEKKSKYNKGSV